MNNKTTVTDEEIAKMAEMYDMTSTKELKMTQYEIDKLITNLYGTEIEDAVAVIRQNSMDMTIKEIMECNKCNSYLAKLAYNMDEEYMHDGWNEQYASANCDLHKLFNDAKYSIYYSNWNYADQLESAVRELESES